jgi:hypothetical protein
VADGADVPYVAPAYAETALGVDVPYVTPPYIASVAYMERDGRLLKLKKT